QMSGNLRLVLLLSQTFQWSHTRIAAYLHADGESISTSDVKQLLVKAYQALEDALPEDIRDIYLAQPAVTA
ncbi:MAG: sigma-70 family RNA polymerase sigma factor, partial [Pseudanabaena sp.]